MEGFAGGSVLQGWVAFLFKKIDIDSLGMACHLVAVVLPQRVSLNPDAFVKLCGGLALERLYRHTRVGVNSVYVGEWGAVCGWGWEWCSCMLSTGPALRGNQVGSVVKGPWCDLCNLSWGCCHPPPPPGGCWGWRERERAHCGCW